ncbi:MAG TPA: hypothetical protein VGK19_01140 [Capsulimonadaceae bacterium]
MLPTHVAVHVPLAVDVAACALSALCGPATPAAAEIDVRRLVPLARDH